MPTIRKSSTTTSPSLISTREPASAVTVTGTSLGRFVTLSRLDEPLSSGANRSKVGRWGERVSTVMTNGCDGPLMLPARSSTTTEIS